MPAFQNTDVQGPPIWLKASLGDGLSPATPYVPSVAIVDASGNQITTFSGGDVSTSGADNKSNTANAQIVESRNYGFDGTNWDRELLGTTGAVSTFQGMKNILPYGIYNSTAPSPTNGQGVLFQIDAAANLKVNPGIYNGVPTESSVSVATSSTQILAANANRTFLFIQNQDATNPIFVATDGNAAVADGTCTKIVAGGNRTWENGFIPNGAVFGIATGGTVTTHVEEAS